MNDKNFTKKIAFTVHNYTLYTAGALRGPFVVLVLLLKDLWWGFYYF